MTHKALMNKNVKSRLTDTAALGVDHQRFHLDSGATSHLMNPKTLQDKKINAHADHKSKQPGGAVQCGNGAKQNVLGAVDIGKVKGAKVVDGLSTNLISVGKLCDEGRAILFTDEATYSIPKRQVNTAATCMTKIGKRQPDGLYDSQYDCNHKWMLSSADKAYANSSTFDRENNLTSDQQRGILSLQEGLGARSCHLSRQGHCNHKKSQILRAWAEGLFCGLQQLTNDKLLDTNQVWTHSQCGSTRC